MSGVFASPLRWINFPSLVVWSPLFQRTRFKLHEKGAEVRVEAINRAEPYAGEIKMPPMVPRHFIYGRPFFAFLWRDGAEWPYFGVWNGNDTALEKVQ